MDSTVPSLSIVVCTKDRPDALLRLATSLSVQVDPSSTEIVVIDDGHLPDEVVRRFAELCAPCLTRLVRKDPTHPAGLYGSRRLATVTARAGNVLFVDDDVVLAPDYLATLAALFETDPAAAGFGGVDVHDLPRAPSRVAMWYARFFGLMGRGPGDLGASGYNHAQMTWRSQTAPFRSDFLHGCNMAFRRSALRDLPDLPWLTGHSCCEDLVVSTVARRRGTLAVVPALRVHHLQAPGGRGTTYQRMRSSVANHASFQRWRCDGGGRSAFATGLFGSVVKDLTVRSSKHALGIGHVLSAYMEGIRDAYRSRIDDVS